jgi:hypothetical protein
LAYLTIGCYRRFLNLDLIEVDLTTQLEQLLWSSLLIGRPRTMMRAELGLLYQLLLMIWMPPLLLLDASLIVSTRYQEMVGLIMVLVSKKTFATSVAVQPPLYVS